MRFAHKPFVLLVGDHHNAFHAPPRDTLWSLGAGAAKEFAKARLGNLELLTALGRRFSTPSAISCGASFLHNISPDQSD
jgi:hypothetical protein